MVAAVVAVMVMMIIFNPVSNPKTHIVKLCLFQNKQKEEKICQSS